MKGCCGIGSDDLNEDFDVMRILAIQTAQDEKKTLAIYKEGKEYKYCDAGHAIEQCYDIIEILSQHH